MKEHGYIRLVRAVAAAVHDTLRGLINFPAAYYPLIGEVGGINVMGASQDEIATYYALHPAKPQASYHQQHVYDEQYVCSMYTEGFRDRQCSAPIIE